MCGNHLFISDAEWLLFLKDFQKFPVNMIKSFLSQCKIKAYLFDESPQEELKAKTRPIS